MAGRNLTLKDFMELPREEQNRRYKDLSDKDRFAARIADVSTKEVFIPCNYCSHYHGFAKCDAYPDRIPKEVMDSVTKDESFLCSENAKYENLGHKWKRNDDE